MTETYVGTDIEAWEACRVDPRPAEEAIPAHVALEQGALFRNRLDENLRTGGKP